jgi:uncharacterized membrane protein YhfC
MSMLDTLWVLSIGAALFALILEVIVFYLQGGRAKIYYGGLIAAFALHAAISLPTSIYGNKQQVWFQLPRTISWFVICIACMMLLLYQLGKLNGKS